MHTPQSSARRGPSLSGTRSWFLNTVRFHLLALGLVAWLVPGASPLRAAAPAGYSLVWSEEFSGSQLDTNKWRYEDLGAWRQASNTADAVSVANGVLKIKTYTTSPGQHRTAKISTRGKFAPTYGYMEVRAAFSSQWGMWSAIWMLSETFGQTVGDPARSGIEIDIVEHRAHDRAGNYIADRFNMALHWDGYNSNLKSKDLGLSNQRINIGGWNTYAFIWTPDWMQIYVDGVLEKHITYPVSRAPQYLYLSSEVEGTSWAGPVPGAGYGSRDSSWVNMQVDYIRYYQRP